MIINKEQVDCVDSNGYPSKKIIVSYIDKQGLVKFLQYPVPAQDMFKWVYTRKSMATPGWQSYDHRPVRKVPVKWLPENRINEILEDICDRMPECNEIFDMNIPVTWTCDIETDVDDDGFSNSDSARTPVNAISMARFPDVIVWGRKELSEKDIALIRDKFKNYKGDSKDTEIVSKYRFTYRGFNNESDMLRDYFSFIKDIPAICGWNFLEYDWKYLYNRATTKLGLDISDLSPTGKFYNFSFKINTSFPKNSVQLPMHKIIYDYMMLYERWDKTVEIRENNSLDYVSQAVLGYKKVEHNLGFQEFYRQEYNDYVFYNAVDSILVDQIDKKIKTSNIWYSLTSELHTELNFEFSTVKPAEIVLNNFLHKKHMMIPEQSKGFDKERRAYKGAFVWKTQPGIYKCVGSGDFASLYPTTIRQFNMSPETFKKRIYTELDDNNPQHERLRAEKIEEYRRTKLKKDEILTKSGAIFDNTFEGIVPEVLTFYFKKRKQSKAIRKQIDKEREYLKKVLDDRRKKVKS